jgi:hypothetical protein
LNDNRCGTVTAQIIIKLTLGCGFEKNALSVSIIRIATFLSLHYESYSSREPIALIPEIKIAKVTIYTSPDTQLKYN